ncbi:MAG: hypothetical protein M9944_00650 [Rhizobiaceae bacterium]|nr:hypothetical protein [Rhizobiaceae bacterium]
MSVKECADAKQKIKVGGQKAFKQALTDRDDACGSSPLSFWRVLTERYTASGKGVVQSAS